MQYIRKMVILNGISYGKGLIKLEKGNNVIEIEYKQYFPLMPDTMLGIKFKDHPVMVYPINDTTMEITLSGDYVIDKTEFIVVDVLELKVVLYGNTGSGKMDTSNVLDGFYAHHNKLVGAESDIDEKEEMMEKKQAIQQVTDNEDTSDESDDGVEIIERDETDIFIVKGKDDKIDISKEAIDIQDAKKSLRDNINVQENKILADTADIKDSKIKTEADAHDKKQNDTQKASIKNKAIDAVAETKKVDTKDTVIDAKLESKTADTKDRIIDADAKKQNPIKQADIKEKVSEVDIKKEAQIKLDDNVIIEKNIDISIKKTKTIRAESSDVQLNEKTEQKDKNINNASSEIHDKTQEKGKATVKSASNPTQKAATQGMESREKKSAVAQQEQHRVSRMDNNPYREKSLIDDIINNDIDCDKSISFYERIKTQLEDLLNNNEKNNSLCEMIEDSMWVNVPYEDNKYYFLGIIKEKEVPLYIGYGVYGLKNVKPDSNYQWIPDLKSDNKKGYWIVLQDAVDGKIVG